MSNTFPIRIRGYRGTEFEVSREAVLDDYAATVRQFDDLTTERREEIISKTDDEALRIWFMEQWTWEDAIGLGKRVTPWPGGNKKTFTNNMHMRGMAGDYEVKP
jgi:hypothetical protein